MEKNAGRKWTKRARRFSLVTGSFFFSFISFALLSNVLHWIYTFIFSASEVMHWSLVMQNTGTEAKAPRRLSCGGSVRRRRQQGWGHRNAGDAKYGWNARFRLGPYYGEASRFKLSCFLLFAETKLANTLKKLVALSNCVLFLLFLYGAILSLKVWWGRTNIQCCVVSIEPSWQPFDELYVYHGKPAPGVSAASQRGCLVRILVDKQRLDRMQGQARNLRPILQQPSEVFPHPACLWAGWVMPTQLSELVFQVVWLKRMARSQQEIGSP